MRLKNFGETLKLQTMNDFELKPMTVAKLKVVRKTDFGAFLDAGTGNSDDDILLHKNQQTAEVKLGDKVEVFLYLAPNKRLTASMRVPKMKVGQIARLKVIAVTKDGAFLEVGAERGIFMPFAEMLDKLKVGDIVWAKLYLDEKSGRLATSMKVSDEIQRAAKPARNVQIGDKITGAIYNITKEGAFLFTEERFVAFIPKNEFPRFLKVGENLDARITFIRPDGTLEASLKDTKEFLIDSDAEKIFKYMQENGGKISLHDKSAPEEIFEVFHISKAAFKNACGHLLKERRIEKVDNGFRIVVSS